MKVCAVWVALFLSLSIPAFSQVLGDYRSNQSGNWNVPATWQRFNGITWVAATATPTNLSGSITIQSAHEVTVPAGLTLTADQLTVDGVLTIASGGQLNIANGAGTDLTAVSASSLVSVSGTLQINNGAILDNQSIITSVVFQSGSVYRHSYTTSFGDLPAATWDPNSTVSVVGFANTTEISAPVSWAQTIGNFTYHTPSQRATVNFAGQLTNILGDFTVTSSGSSRILQLSAGENPTISIAGDVAIGGNSRVVFGTSGNATIVNVAGNWNQTSTNSGGSYLTYTGNTTINLSGDFIMNANTGRLHMAGPGTTGVGTLNMLEGDFSVISGRIDELGAEPSQGNLRFVKNGTQIFVNTGLILTHINYFVSPVTTLDLSIYPVTGSLNTVALEGTLIVGDPDTLGAIQNTTSRGNIRTTVAGRSYASGSTIIYRGSSPLYIGSGQPADAGVVTIIDNAGDVRLSRDVVINGTLRLDQGSLDLNGYELTSAGSLETNGGTLAGTLSSDLVIEGTAGGDWGTLVFDPARSALGTLTLNRTGVDAGVSLNGVLEIGSALNLTRGQFNNISGLSFSDGALVTRYNTASLEGAVPTVSAGFYDVHYRTFSVAGGPFAAVSTGVEVGSPGLGSLTIGAAQTNDTFSMSSDITINEVLNLNRGTLAANGFSLTMQGTSAWNDNTGSFDPGTGTVIFNGATIVGGTSNAVFNHIDLTAGSSLQITRNFTITGNINFEPGNVFDMGNAIAIFSGTASQTVSANGATFSNINISKSGSGITLTSALNLVGMLQFVTPSANINVASNGFLRLLSTTDAPGSGNGMIFRLASGNTVTGDVTVERYMSGEGKIYRYITTPVSGAMMSQWKDDFAITGNFNDPSPNTIVCGVKINPASPSLFYYDETQPGVEDEGYVAYPLPGTATTNSPIVVGRGYAAYIRVCDTVTLVDVTGPINQGIVQLPVTYTPGTPEAAGYNLVGNPFPCTIDWDYGPWTKTRIASVISITDNGSGMVRYYDPGVANDIPNGQIAPGQAFFVRATAANPILIARENSKVAVGAEFFRQGYHSIPSFALNFSNGTNYDRAYVKLVDGAASGLDDFDAPKISNPAFSFSTVATDNIPMAINAVGEISCGQELRIDMRGVEPGEYAVSLELRADYFDEYRFVLVDHYLNSSVTLTKATPVKFSVTNDAASKAANRFTLQLEKALPVVTITSAGAICGDHEAVVTIPSTRKDITYTVWTAAGKQLTSEINGNGNVLGLSVPNGELSMGQNKLKIVAQSCAGQVESEITIEKYEPEILAVDQLLQPNGLTLLTASAGSDRYTFNWYDEQSGEVPVHSGDTFEPALNDSRIFHVEAVSQDGCVSPRIAVTVNGPEGMVFYGLQVYPNPVKADLFVEVLTEDIQTIDFTNILGQVVSSIPVNGKTGKMSVDWRSFRQGMYLMTVNKKLGKQSFRLFKE